MVTSISCFLSKYSGDIYNVGKVIEKIDLINSKARYIETTKLGREDVRTKLAERKFRKKNKPAEKKIHEDGDKHDTEPGTRSKRIISTFSQKLGPTL